MQSSTNVLKTLLSKINNMNTIRAQISIFIVISILILFIGTYLVFFINQGEQNLIEQEQSTNLDSSTQEIKETIQGCLQLGIEEQLRLNLLTGGYYDIPSIYVYDTYLTVPFYVHNSVRNSASIPELEEQLELALNDNLKYCVNNLEEYEIRFESIYVGEFNTDITITNDKILSELIVPISLKEIDSQNSINLEKFETQVPSKVENRYNLVQEFINLHEGNYENIPISDLSLLAYQNNFTYEMNPQNSNIIIYSFIFENPLRQEDTVYQFAINYNWEEEQ